MATRQWNARKVWTPALKASMPCPLTKQEGPSAVELRGPFDIRPRHPGELRSAFRGVLRRPLGQRVEAVAPALDKVAVVAVVLHQPVDHRQSDGGIRAGPGPQPHIRDGRRRCLTGIDDHDAGTLRPGALEGLPLRRVGRIRIAPDDERTTGVVDILALADGQPRDPVAQRPAPAAQVLVHHPVGRAEGAQQQRQHHPAAEVRVAHRTAERRRAIPLPHRQHRRPPSRPAPRPTTPAATAPHPAAPCASWDRAPGPDDRSAPATPGSPSRRTPPATPDAPDWATPASRGRPPPSPATRSGRCIPSRCWGLWLWRCSWHYCRQSTGA